MTNPVCVSDDYEMIPKRLGDSRGQDIYAFKTLLASGIVTPSGSDSPVDPIDPLIGMYAAVNQTDFRTDLPEGGWHPEQKLTRGQALKSFTIWGAYAQHAERLKGPIEDNKPADFIVIDRNVMRIPALDIKDVKVLMTVIAGESVYNDAAYLGPVR